MFVKWKVYRTIKKSGFFDPVYYLLNNPDVRSADVDPLLHFIHSGWKDGKNPSEYFDVQFYLRNYPDVAQSKLNPLYHYICYGIKEGRLINPENHGKNDLPLFSMNAKRKLLKIMGKINLNTLMKVIRYWRLHDFKSLINRIRWEFAYNKLQVHPGENVKNEKAQEIINNILTISKNQNTYEKIIKNQFPALKPLNFYQTPRTDRRINLVTDSINSGSLFGGVATSMILATLIAEKWDCELRVITRTEPPNKHNYQRIIKNTNLSNFQKVNFSFVDCFNDNSELSIGDDEYFLTTSWWTTHSVLNSFNANKIFYLIQEDERSFYPFGDDYYLCSQILRNNQIKYFVNSQLLYNSFLSAGFDNIRKHGDWFEPSFPKNIFYYEQRDPINKKNFFFYARPIHLRNLYYLGLRVINQALEIGLLDPTEWNINFIGKDLEKITLANSVEPNIYQNLPWDEYAKIIRKMDLGLSLMYSPHPSYPPLDLAASGSVAITNKYMNKQSLDNYSKNIICCDLDEKSLLDGIKKGIVLTSDRNERINNYNNNNIGTDWKLSFNKILTAI